PWTGPEGSTMTDADLVRQTLAGRTEAYEQLVRHWAARVTALCHAKVGRADVADDLAQETLLRGYRGLHSPAAPEKVGAWLCGIALRTCLDWLKAKERSQIPFSALSPDRNPEDFLPARDGPGEAGVDHDDECRHLLAEVEALPENYRKVVMLYYYQDL